MYGLEFVLDQRTPSRTHRHPTAPDDPRAISNDMPLSRTLIRLFFIHPFQWHPSLFDETVVCRAYIKHVPMQLVELGEEVHYVNYPDEVYTWERFGVLVSFHEVAVRGDIAFFSWNALIYCKS